MGYASFTISVKDDRINEYQLCMGSALPDVKKIGNCCIGYFEQALLDDEIDMGSSANKAV